nr:unnamed protein product [Digitaria exilis]
MPLQLPSSATVVAALPRALSLSAAAVAAATTTLLLISAVVSRSHHVASSSSSPPLLPPSASASTTDTQAPAPAPDAEHHHHPPPPPPVPPCPPNATHLVPCHESPSGDRHCPPRPPPPLPHPPKDHPPHPPPPPPPHCRVPPPPGYRPPPPWPVRRERARYANVEFPLLPPAKVPAGQDPAHGRREWLVFAQGKGVRDYVEQIERVVPLRGGVVRTALDIGCGVASFGDYLLNYGVLTMSIAPKNIYGAQVQLALERGLPAMIRGFGAQRLPYPSSEH